MRFWHWKSDDPTAHIHKHLRLPELLCKLFDKLIRQIYKIILTDTCKKKVSGNNIIDVAILITERTVKRQAIQFALLVADEHNRLLVGIHSLDISADCLLHTAQIISNISYIRSLFWLYH